jgi:F-type H+-transporting ATPase subunit delta
MRQSGTTARRYAEAAFELARRDGTEDAWHVALDASARILGSEAVQRIVDNPAIPLQERLAAVRATLAAETLGGFVDDLLEGRRGLVASAAEVREGIASPVLGQLVNLVGLLVERRRVSLVAAIASEYQRLLPRSRGVVSALVTSAAPLTHDETDAVLARIEAMTGAGVSLRTEIDPALIGGLTVRVGDRLLDASVRGRLQRLRGELLAGSRQAHG